MNTAESIRSDRPVAMRSWSSSHEELAAYFKRQYPSSVRGGKALLKRLDFSKTQTLLDAGGGAGGLAVTIAEAHPHICCTIADMPDVVAVCEHFIKRSSASQRLSTQPIDLTRSRPERDYDAAVLRTLIQVLSREDAKRVLRNVHDALKPGGHAYISGTFVRDDHCSPPADVNFGLVFLNVYEHGAAYTESEIKEWLSEAGFEDVAVEFEALDDEASSCLVTARRPPD